jgi:hypothetical protein
MGVFLAPPPAPAAIVIMNDGGGDVIDYTNAAARYDREGRRVEIRGSCRSACTLALSVRNVCVGNGAVLKWHQAYEIKGHVLRPDVTNAMLDTLPVRVQKQLSGKVQRTYSPEATLNYEQLVKLGIPDCDPTAPTVRAERTLSTKRAVAKDAFSFSWGFWRENR